MEKGRLAITGASGFIGRHVASEASKQGYEVVCVDRNKPENAYAGFFSCDIRDPEALRKAFSGVEYVIHLAAITSNIEFEKSIREGYDINVTGFMDVLDAALGAGCKKLVYASSAAVYLKESGFFEDSVIDIRLQKNHYAKTKLIDEMLADSYRGVCDMAITGLRFFNVYGEGENEKGNYASIITQFLRADSKSEPLVIYGDGSQRRDFVNVADAARITLMALERGTADIYNVGSGSAISYEDIADIINAKNKRHVPNPLSSYQYLTIADTKRLRTLIGDYKFIEAKEGIIEMMKDFEE